jgi:hypothetical protein
MEKIFVLLILLTVGGCTSNSVPENEQLPWDKPSNWELRRDISSGLHFQKGPEAEDLSRRHRR